MRFLNAICLIALLLFNIRKTKGLLAHGNSNTSDLTYGFHGHTVVTTDIMQILLNQTSEWENLLNLQA